MKKSKQFALLSRSSKFSLHWSEISRFWSEIHSEKRNKIIFFWSESQEKSENLPLLFKCANFSFFSNNNST